MALLVGEVELTGAQPVIRATILRQRKRKRVEEMFGWTKTVGNLRKAAFYRFASSREPVRWTSIAFNLVRMRNLGGA